MKAAIVSHRKDVLHEFVKGLGGDVDWFVEPGEFLRKAPKTAWNLVVLDALLPGLDDRVFLQDLLRVNSLLNTAVISGMGEPEFMEYSGGLGVLCAVPAVPDWEDGVRIMNRLCLFYDMG